MSDGAFCDIYVPIKYNAYIMCINGNVYHRIAFTEVKWLTTEFILP